MERTLNSIRGVAKRVIYVLPKPDFYSQYEGIGGHVTHSKGIVEGFIANDWNVTVISGQELKINMSGFQDVDCIEMQEKLSKTHPGRSFRNLIWRLKLIQRIKKSISREVKFVYVRYSMSFSIFLPVLRWAIQPLPLIVEVNSLLCHNVKISGKLWNSLFTLFDKFSLRSARVLTAVSQPLKDDILKCLGSRYTNQVVVIPNGGSESLLATIPSDHHEANGFIKLVYAGIFKDYYDIKGLVEVFSRLRETLRGVELHLYGDGPTREEVASAVSRHDGVFLHGGVSWEHVAHVLGREADVLLLPWKPHNHSILSPIKLYEYMAAGKAIVASNVGQIRDVIQDGVNGLLYDPNDLHSLESMLCKAITNDSLRQSLGSQARKNFKEKHTWKKRVESLLNELEKYDF